MTNDTWTPLIGLRRAGVRLLVRSVVAFVVWAALVWAMTPVLNQLFPHWAILAVIAIVLTIPGVSIGHALSRNLAEIAGMASILLIIMTIVFVWAAIVSGVKAAHHFKPLGDWQAGFAMISAGVWASLWSIRNTLLEK